MMYSTRCFTIYNSRDGGKVEGVGLQYSVDQEDPLCLLQQDDSC